MSLQDMYRTISADPFPDAMTVTLGETTLTYEKRTWTIDGEKRGLRYGENPDQPAALYVPAKGTLELDGITFRGPDMPLVAAITEEHMLQAGKHPGKTNLTDVDNGLNILQYLMHKPACVILKHNNPCGAAWSDESLTDALTKAHASDQIAAFGGAVVVNRPLDNATALVIASHYFEVICAPAFDDDALETLKQKKNLRIIRIPGIAQLAEAAHMPFLDLKSLTDGSLVAQFSFRNRILSTDDFLPAEATDKEGTTATARTPTKQEASDLLFTWAVEAGVTSNSVIFARDGATIAIGTGEQDRVGVVLATIAKAHKKYADALCREAHDRSIFELQLAARTDGEAAKALSLIEDRVRADNGGLTGSVLVSDGFFPFRDGVDLALEQGVTAIAQPGGSIRDTEVIGACNEASPQVAMVFTGQRSFKH